MNYENTRRFWVSKFSLDLGTKYLILKADFPVSLSLGFSSSVIEMLHI